MLRCRGRPENADAFGAISFHAGDPNLADRGHMISDILGNLSHESIFGQKEEPLDARQAVDVLSARLGKYSLGK